MQRTERSFADLRAVMDKAMALHEVGDTFYTSIYYAQQPFDAVTVTTSNW